MINTYFLKGTSANGIGLGDGECVEKETSNFKNLYTLLGIEFVLDKDNINGGYPILKWQKK